MSTQAVAENSASEQVEEQPKMSNGQRFKEFFGYSKSMARMMNKYYCSTPEQYRLIRKKNKKSRK